MGNAASSGFDDDDWINESKYCDPQLMMSSSRPTGSEHDLVNMEDRSYYSFSSKQQPHQSKISTKLASSTSSTGSNMVNNNKIDSSEGTKRREENNSKRRASNGPEKENTSDVSDDEIDENDEAVGDGNKKEKTKEAFTKIQIYPWMKRAHGNSNSNNNNNNDNNNVSTKNGGWL